MSEDVKGPHFFAENTYWAHYRDKDSYDEAFKNSLDAIKVETWPWSKRLYNQVNLKDLPAGAKLKIYWGNCFGRVLIGYHGVWDGEKLIRDRQAYDR